MSFLKSRIPVNPQHWQYSAKEKLAILKFYREVCRDPAIRKKKETFVSDPRSRGAKWCMMRAPVSIPADPATR
jgi:hypothetical protein